MFKSWQKCESLKYLHKAKADKQHIRGIWYLSKLYFKGKNVSNTRYMYMPQYKYA